MRDAISSLNRGLAKRYVVERELGVGGMARVYLARDLRHARPVAIKVLKPELASVVGADRFLGEIRTTAKLQHPHILPLYDSGQTNGLLFYVMPYVEGESLRQRLDRETRLPVGDAIRIARMTASALQYAHDQGVIHRDIKPENILLQAGEPLVADFGIALALSEAASPRLTETGASVGTPRYMSPEQASGEADPGPESDIYSLACVLYELLTGEPPHTGPNVRAVLVKVMTEQPISARSRRASIPDSVDAAIMKSLSKSARHRHSSAAAFARALDTGPGAGAVQPRRHTLVEKKFTLTADLCRRLDRADLDARMIGDRLAYWDNEVDADVLVIHLHGFGGDYRTFRDALETTPYHGIAPVLYGFEPDTDRRAALSMDAHLVLLRHFIENVRAAAEPDITLLLGFSSGADLLFRAIAGADEDWTRGIDGLLALSPNVSLDTCFVTGVLARHEPGAGDEILPDLLATGAGATTLGEWLNTHEYLVTVLRKFQADFAALRRHGRDITGAFEDGSSVFPAWFRAAAARIGAVRCVFADSELERGAVEQVLFEHLDSGTLGDAYREDSIVIEDAADHFDLAAARCINKHVDQLVRRIRGG